MCLVHACHLLQQVEVVMVTWMLSAHDKFHQIPFPVIQSPGCILQYGKVKRAWVASGYFFWIQKVFLTNFL